MLFSPISTDCYCAFCRSPRKVYTKRHITGINIVLSFIAALALMFIVWQSFDPRGIVFYVVALFVAEVFIQVRWRLTLPCSHCGFDPVVYLKDADKAAEKVKRFYEKRQNDPDFYFSQSPLIELAKEQQRRNQKQDSQKPQETSQGEGQVLSKRT